MDVASECRILLNLKWELDIALQDIKRRTHSTSSHPCIKDVEMREVKGLASVLKDTVEKLKAAHADATKLFEKEVDRSQVNLGKVNSLTHELAEANKEMEAVLADSGSNFPPSESALTDGHGEPLKSS